MAVTERPTEIIRRILGKDATPEDVMKCFQMYRKDPDNRRPEAIAITYKIMHNL